MAIAMLQLQVFVCRTGLVYACVERFRLQMPFDFNRLCEFCGVRKLEVEVCFVPTQMVY